MTPEEQEILRASLEKTCEAFFKKRASKKSKLVLANGRKAGDNKQDAVGLLVVLSGWAGDLIGHAPEHMRDNLFLSFADTVTIVAGIKDEGAQELESVQ